MVGERFLRNDEHPDAEFGQNRCRRRRHRGRVAAAREALERLGADARPGLLDEAAVGLDVALLQPGQHRLRGFDEAVGRFVLVELQALVLDPRQAAAHTEHRATVGHGVEHGHVLGDADGRIPRQHDDHRADLDRRMVAGHVGQELRDVGVHDVVGKVVLDAPHRLEAEVRGFLGDRHVLPIDLVIRDGLVGILKNRRMSDVHGRSFT